MTRRLNVHDETGAGTVLTVTMIALISAIGLVALAICQFAIDRSHASSAADLGALSGAERTTFGDACNVASAVVARNSARVEICEVSGQDVLLEVSVNPGPLLARIASYTGRDSPRIHAVARAGPPG